MYLYTYIPTYIYTYMYTYLYIYVYIFVEETDDSVTKMKSGCDVKIMDV